MDEAGQKKTSFDDLSRDDLIKKCKLLLNIAQKAKQSKKDATSEIDILNEKCQRLELQKTADKNSLRTMQEIIDSLTEQKLHCVTEMDKLKNQNVNLNSILEQTNELLEESKNENERSKENSHVVHNKLANLEIENISLKRQNDRLVSDNDNLMSQLDKLEAQIEILNKLGLEQQRQLLCLENLPQEESEDQNYQIKSSEDRSSLTAKCETLEKSISELESTIVTLREELDDKASKISEVTKQYEVEKAKKEKANLKLKAYRDKLAKCDASISQLKNSKSVLLKTVRDYSESVPKWQRDILNASKLLSEQLLKLESENNQLNERIASQNKSEPSKEILSAENDALVAKLTALQANMKRLENESVLCSNNLKSVQEEYDSLSNRLKSMESEKLILINEKSNAKDVIQKLELDNTELRNSNKTLLLNAESLSGEITQLKLKIDEFENEKQRVDSVSSHNDDNANTISELKEELASIKSALVAIEEENKLLLESNEMLKDQLNNVSDDQPTLEMRRLIEQNDLLQTDISKLQTKMASFKNENVSLHGELKELRQRMSDNDALLQDYESLKTKYANYKTENVELLKEMKEINQALKERGEVISKQQMELSEWNRKAQALDDEIKSLKESIDRKDGQIQDGSNNSSEKYQELVAEKENLESLLKERDNIIIALQDDIEKLKHNQTNILCDTRSDNLSVSTMSRVEESARLKEVDESFEERYAKLRTLAIKMKKHVSELTVQNKNLEESNAKLEQENKSLLAKSESGTLKNDSTSATANEESEKNKETKETVPVKDKENAVTKSDEVQKSKLMDMEKASFDIIAKELRSQISAQKATIEELTNKLQENAAIKEMLALKESKLALEESQHQVTKEALEKAKREVKKKSVLSLEMEDYERSMKDMTNKMEEDKKKIIQMESTIDTLQATVGSLKTQIKMLEEQISTEERISREVKGLLNKATENLKEKEAVIQSKNEAISSMERNLEDLKLQTEDANLQLASVLGEREKRSVTYESEKSEMIARFKAFENRYNDVDEKLKLKSIELEDLKSEFSNYKVRAQSVLRQNNTKDLSVEENLKEELASLKSEVEKLNDENDNFKSQLESIQSERCHLLIRCGELQSTLSATQSEREKIADQYSQLLQKEAQEQKNIKLQMTTLTQCYKKQIADLEESTAEQIDKLKKELEFSRASIARAGIVPAKEVNGVKKPLQFIAIDNLPSSNDSGDEHVHDSIDSIVNVSMLEREEGEGSESTPSPSPTTAGRMNRQVQRCKREPVPLEQLLTTGVPEDLPPYEDSTDVDQQLLTALKRIEMKDKQLSHMTELVAEAEKEVARRTQLVETLKEEIRRCQRALDRGLHHHNQEYLKNVIVKFLTLNAGDERSRLVPVLNTILTLSPEETNQLNAVAKGIDLNSNRGWGSYLSWPSSNR